MIAGKEVKCLIKISTEFLYSTKISHYSGTENYQLTSTVCDAIQDEFSILVMRLQA